MQKVRHSSGRQHRVIRPRLTSRLEVQGNWAIFSVALTVRGLVLGVAFFVLAVAGCERARGPQKVVLDPNDDAAIERFVRQVIAEERKIAPEAVDMNRPFNQSPLNCDALDVGTIAIRIQQKLGFHFTDEEFGQWDKKPRWPHEESPDWLAKLTKRALVRVRAGK